jgi:hypothetical protein
LAFWEREREREKKEEKPINKLSRRLMTCEDFQSFMKYLKAIPHTKRAASAMLVKFGL